jgi:hypothetical protein
VRGDYSHEVLEVAFEEVIVPADGANIQAGPVACRKTVSEAPSKTCLRLCVVYMGLDLGNNHRVTIKFSVETID